MKQALIAAIFTVTSAALLSTSAAYAQVAAVPYLGPAGLFGFGGSVDVQDWRGTPDEDGFRKGFTFRSFSAPVSAFGSASQFSLSGLTTDGSQYSYSFKGVGDTPMTVFGGITSLRTSPDVFTSYVTPGFERTSTFATGFNAGIEFKPAPNLSLSLSGSFVQPSVSNIDTDLRSQLISQQNPAFRNLR